MSLSRTVTIPAPAVPHQAERAASPAASHWRSIYLTGAIGALGIVLLGVLDIVITFIPGVEVIAAGERSVVDWFNWLQANAFLGLRDLGIFNVLNVILGIPLYLALWAAHRDIRPAYATLAVLLFCVSAAIYISNNQALTLLGLSSQYAAADESQKALLAAAGQVILAQAEDFSPGTFPGFCLNEAAGLLMAFVLLRGGVFSRRTGAALLLGVSGLFIFTVFATFAPSTFNAVMFIALLGGLASLAAHILIARRLFQLGGQK